MNKIVAWLTSKFESRVYPDDPPRDWRGEAARGKFLRGEPLTEDEQSEFRRVMRDRRTLGLMLSFGAAIFFACVSLNAGHPGGASVGFCRGAAIAFGLVWLIIYFAR